MSKQEEITCRVLTEQEYPSWDHFISEHPEASVYHLSIWRHILKNAFGKTWYAIGAFQQGKVSGGIPLVHMKSSLFGNHLVSMPYVNYGGILVDQECILEPLIHAAKNLARELNVDHIEFRHLLNLGIELPVKTEKVSMWLALPETAEDLLKGFNPKLRSQVRKGEKNGLEARCGGGELLDEFYSVFAQNMRDLGTPVYGKGIFQLILEAFPKSARVVVVRDPSHKPIAGGFLLGYRNRIEIPWASSLRAFNYLQSNMFLYWNCLKYACEEGYQTFDFGRSSKGSSTYKFKAQWGSKPVSHYWHYYLCVGQQLPQLNPQNPKFRLAIAMWQNLPIPLTKILGPLIAKNIP